MSTFWVEYDKDDRLRLFKAVRRLERETPKIINDMQFVFATKFFHKLVNNISSNKYGAVYTPYIEKYASWKEKYFSKRAFWVLSGDLLAALKVWPYSQTFGRNRVNGWQTGIPANVTDSGGKNWSRKGQAKPIAMYARILEYGGNFGKGGKHKPRPMFGPTTIDFEKNDMEKLSRPFVRKIKALWK